MAAALRDHRRRSGGNSAATHAARLGAEVTLDRARRRRRRRPPVGLHPLQGDDRHRRRHVVHRSASRAWAWRGAAPTLDLDRCRARIADDRRRSCTPASSSCSNSQGVRMHRRSGRLKGPNEVVVETADGVEELEADAILVATGSRPRIPDWATVDGDRVLTTRQAYPPPELPAHLVVIGSGVTGVEFVHMFTSLGCEVTLVVSRQQVLPQKDPEVAAALEDEFLRRGRAPPQGGPGRRPSSAPTTGCRRALRRRPRRRRRRTRCSPSARSRTPRASASTPPASRSTTAATSRSTTTASRTCRTSTPPATCRGSCRCRRWPPCRAARSPST